MTAPPKVKQFVDHAYQGAHIEPGKTNDHSCIVNVGGRWILGWLYKGDVSLLCEYAENVPAGGTIVEIGSYLGLSSAILAGSTLGQVFCVDPWDDAINNYTDSYPTFLSNMRGLNSLFPIRAKSVDAARWWPGWLHAQYNIESPAQPEWPHYGAPVDLLFIDGEHKQAHEDLDAWLPHVKTGGVVMFHDCVKDSAPLDAVDVACGDCRLDLISFHDPDRDDCHYMAVTRKR